MPQIVPASRNGSENNSRKAAGNALGSGSGNGMGNGSGNVLGALGNGPWEMACGMMQFFHLTCG